MAITFEKLPEPINITDPVKATFTEYRVYRDIVLHIADSTISSIYESGVTPETFVLREILQNAIDSEISKTGDFLGAYRRVKSQKIGNWNLVESEGTLDEDIFLFGYSTKEQEEGKPCRLIGRFGVGLKESIFVLLYDGKHMYMAFNGHIYGFGYYYNGKVYYDLDLDTIKANARYINPVILRGEYNVKGKVLVYVPASVESVMPLLYPYEKPYHVSNKEKGLVYHNGLYSGEWVVPLDVNVCNVTTNQYRTVAYITAEFIHAMEMIVDDEMPEAFKDILLRYVVKEGRLLRIKIPTAFELFFNLAGEKLSKVLQKALNMAVEEVAKMMGEKFIIVDRYTKFPSNEIMAIALPDIIDSYINGVRSYLAKKGYKVYSYAEAVSGKLHELFNTVIEPEVPEKVRALIKLGEWLYSIGVELMDMYNIPGALERMMKIGTVNFKLLDPIPGIFNIDVRVVKPEYNGLLTDAVGITITINDKPIILLRNLPEDQWLLYVGIMLHELNHIYSDFEHGTFQWENIYNVLYMIDVLAPSATPYIINLIRLAVHNPKLFLEVNDITHLPSHVLPIPLIVNGECPGYIDERGVVCQASSPIKLKLVNHKGSLVLEEVVG